MTGVIIDDVEVLVYKRQRVGLQAYSHRIGNR